MANKSRTLVDALELRVLAGRQAGARARLDPQQSLLVCGLNAANQGDTQFADILLSSQVDFQARLVPAGQGRVGLQLISGEAQLAGRALPAGNEVRPWAPGQPLQLGDARVAYGPAEVEHWPEPVMHDGPELLAGPRTLQRKAAAPAARHHPVVEGLLTVLGLVMVIGGAAVAMHGGTLREAGRAIAGVMPATPAAAPAAPPDAMAAAVDVFRLHGIAAQGSWSPEGELVLRTQERDGARVQAAAAAARRDVARLPTLRVDNQPPAPTGTATAGAPAPDDPAKRLVAVVDNADSPYFVTADGSRYFSGALLPSGHRVVQIAERAVIVERDGLRTRLVL
ncbi:hypothetical protein [Roseateles asaccharophilus]|uniref:YscD/Y4YQ C-terminal domain-containing protein n=1 Tax=Roseateles asaccharophilus TaxID=582607 RepID=A0ABU2AAA8_9BURK|nr:hypothetical protein [Roseateles asaccharophilus]MDR7333402.1 hypothetical protein [Roseateles asaccharophilus]